MEFHGILKLFAVSQNGVKIPGAIFALRDRYGREKDAVSDGCGVSLCYLFPELEYEIRIKKPPSGYTAAATPVSVKCDRRLVIYSAGSRVTELGFNITKVTVKEVRPASGDVAGQ